MSKSLRGFPRHIRLEDKINFARHLSIVIQAGLPLMEGLKIIREQTASKKLGRIIDQLIVDINSGQFLAASLGKFPTVFDDFFVNIVQVGEVSGTLASNLSYLSAELKKSRELRGKVTSAMVYPMVVLVVMLVIVGFLVFFIFPKILPIFQNLNVQLPTTTRVLINVSQFMLSYWFYLLAAMIVIIIVARLVMRLQKVKMLWHRSLLYVPVLSDFIVGVNVANSVRVLGVLLKSGIKIVDAMKTTSKTFNNLAYRQAFMEAADTIQRGETMVHYMNTQKRLFPSLMSGLIQIGETTGNLENNLEYLANYYSEEVETRLRNLTVLLEPFLLLTIGIIVGFVAIAIILPIYQITQGVK